MRDWPKDPTMTLKRYGNFRPDKTSRYWPSRASKIKARRAQREGRNEAHLALVRLMPCCACGSKRSVHAHHIRYGLARNRAAGRKGPDLLTVPVCFDHHLGANGIHSVGSRREAEWFADHDLDGEALALALGANTGDLTRMLRVLEAHRPAVKLRAMLATPRGQR